MTCAHYLRMGSILGYGAGEIMAMPPGTVFDLWELYRREHKRKGDT